MNLQNRIKFLISGLAFIAILIKVSFPSYKIDETVAFLFALGILPWLANFFKSIELPNGYKIELQDFKRAENEISMIQGNDSELKKSTIELIFSQTKDANLATVALRIEIEKRLKILAQKFNIDKDQNISNIAGLLIEKNVLDSKTAKGLLDLIKYGNQAAHGAIIEKDVKDWIYTSGGQIILDLDYLINNYNLNISKELNEALIILEFQGKKIIEHSVALLENIERDGFARLRADSDVGETLLKLKAIRPIQDHEDSTWEMKHMMTPLGITLLNHFRKNVV